MENLDRIQNFNNGDLVFDVIDQGPLDGQPVVLLHGFPETAKIWENTSKILNKKGFRTYAINQRGYSLGAQPKKRSDYAIQHLTDDIKILLDIINQPVYLIGHDWGAVVAWEVAIQHPDSIKHLTSISVPHRAAFIRAFYGSKQIFKSYYMGLFQIPKIPELLFQKIPSLGIKLLKDSGMTEEQLSDFKNDILNQNRLIPSFNWYRGLPFGSNKNLLKKVRVPTLFIWGKQDVAIDEKGVKLNHQYVQAPYTEIHLDANHWIPIQNYEQLTDLFLKEHQKFA